MPTDDAPAGDSELSRAWKIQLEAERLARLGAQRLDQLEQRVLALEILALHGLPDAVTEH